MAAVPGARIAGTMTVARMAAVSGAGIAGTMTVTGMAAVSGAGIAGAMAGRSADFNSQMRGACQGLHW